MSDVRLLLYHARTGKPKRRFSFRLFFYFSACAFQNDDRKDPAGCNYEATETVRNILKKQLLTTDLFQQTFLSTILSALDNHTVNNDGESYSHAYNITIAIRKQRIATLLQFWLLINVCFFVLGVINTWLETLLDFIEFLPVDCLQLEVTC